MTRITEQWNPVSKGVDKRPVLEILEIINKEDEKITTAIHNQLPHIAEAVEEIIITIRKGGNVYLVGAGTSGRLCVMEASEIPPTFGLPSGRISAVIAGGVKGFYSSVEAAEDNKIDAATEMEKLELAKDDLVIGVAASGATPFVIGAVEKAKELGAQTVGISCNPDTLLSKISDTPIEVITGPEIVAGSTRMKAGTAQKIVLNMMTTTAMMKLGLVYDGYMVGVQATNKKLRDRSTRIVAEITGASNNDARVALEATGWGVRAAILTILTNSSTGEAVEKLKTHTLRQLLGGLADERA